MSVEGEILVVAHKINFDMLKMMNDIELVERIRGTYVGGGMASTPGRVYVCRQASNPIIIRN